MRAPPEPGREPRGPRSTRLWAADAEAMSASLLVHDDVVRSAIESAAGYVFTTAGDSFAVAFSRASDAVSAALAIQAARNGHEVTIWAREEEVVAGINEAHRNPVFLSTAELPKNISAHGDITESVHDAQMVLCVIPSQFVRDHVIRLRDHLPAGAPKRSLPESNGIIVGGVVSAGGGRDGVSAEETPDEESAESGSSSIIVLDDDGGDEEAEESVRFHGAEVFDQTILESRFVDDIDLGFGDPMDFPGPTIRVSANS